MCIGSCSVGDVASHIGPCWVEFLQLMDHHSLSDEDFWDVAALHIDRDIERTWIVEFFSDWPVNMNMLLVTVYDISWQLNTLNSETRTVLICLL